MAVPILTIILGLYAGHKVKQLIKKWLDVESVEKEVGDLLLEIAKARQDGKIDKEDVPKILAQVKKVGLAYLLKLMK